MGYNYLYVEDDPLSREVMQILLEKVVGVNDIKMFSHSDDFLRRLKALHPQPDFILLDIQIGPHDGYEVLALLRKDEQYGDVTVIAVTASVMFQEVQRLRHGGFDGALAKPLDMATFPGLIERLEAGEPVWQVT